MADIRAFISYSTRDRESAAEVKRALEEFGAIVFVAHDDLRVSEGWRERILAELEVAQVFVPLLSEHFKRSEWAPQELGYAVAKKQLIIPLQLDGTVPFGFASNLQGKGFAADSLHELFVGPLVTRFPRPVLGHLIHKLAGARSFRGAEALMKPLLPYFKLFTAAEIRQFVDACADNGEIWDAALCKVEYLPLFFKVNGKRIPPDRKQRLAELIGVESA